MPKVPLRLVLSVGMISILIVPWNPSTDSERYSSAFFISVFTLEILATITKQTTVSDLAGALSMVLYLQAVPILIVFNMVLSFPPLGKLKTGYRIVLWSLVPWTWYASLFLIDPGWRGPGFWTQVATVSAVALVEVVLLIRELSVRKQNTAMKDTSKSSPS